MQHQLPFLPVGTQLCCGIHSPFSTPNFLHPFQIVVGYITQNFWFLGNSPIWMLRHVNWSWIPTFKLQCKTREESVYPCCIPFTELLTSSFLLHSHFSNHDDSPSVSSAHALRIWPESLLAAEHPGQCSGFGLRRGLTHEVLVRSKAHKYKTK